MAFTVAAMGSPAFIYFAMPKTSIRMMGYHLKSLGGCMSVKVLMIAILQALAVFALCLASKNRFYALLIGAAGAVVVAFIGADRYAGLDLLFVAVATLAALWKLTPYADGETRGEVLAFAGKAAGVVILLIVCGATGLWYYANHGAVIEAAAPAIVPTKPAASLRSMNDEAAQPIAAVPASPQQEPSLKGTSADLRDGMTEAEVIAIMGHPVNVATLVSSGGVRVEAWVYRGANGLFYVYMKNGRKSL